jgi:hypothetical protein
MLRTLLFLIYQRCMLNDVAAGSLDDEIALAIERESIGALDTHLDAQGVDIRRHNVVIFKAPLTAALDEADAGVDVLEARAAIGRDATAPLHAIVADELVAPPR